MTPTVTGLLLARAEDERCGLLFEDRSWSWAEVVRTCSQYASLLRSLRRPGPFHVGVLLGNVPEFLFLLGGAAFSGAVLVGLNPTRRGEALARDVRLTDCQLIITDTAHADLLAGVDVPMLLVDTPPWRALLDEHSGAEHAPVEADPDDLLVLVFTSGTGGDPKAVRCTHGKIAFPGRMLADRFGLTGEDVAYVSMPLFHSNALMAGWAVGAAAGAAIALRRRFSASGFLPDVRRFGVTYANYVGKPLAHVLATPPRPDDADNPLRLVYGNEANERDVLRFAERFGCRVVDGFGSTEGGIAIARTPDTPPGALGKLPEGVAVLNPDTGKPCATAQFSPDGRLLNPEEAIGELVNTTGSGWFAGYYNAPEADAERMRDGMYWSGDLAYLDAEGFCRFAGRTADWLRVDGENLATAPIERILLRHPDIREAAVYAIPDPTTGDQVMAALITTADFAPETLADFLTAQPDLGPKQWPRYIRLTTELPRTATHKILKRHLMSEALDTADPIYHRSDTTYAPAP
ncbi:fatty-acyl-CoA synthase [Saccharopolyspora kobensis]|uniref:Fatty-acyl-CoA synthase n=1 Tax=Saccharopolyspora kobensis TaxID=146035 RepID=A0A1H6EGU7_9PSEU|nr:long-chain-fatty-acid--CoA ligase [Saccharopolyspora kobensis]SEG96491.1 fatty-acyl-CoA synthase [Saccharopolyspora kobensis]SFF07064.1 fatty-acyl-CoA synthase [Saccharopolyspora kobensis]